MKKAYLCIGIQNRQKLDPEITVIQQVLNRLGYSLFVFVDQFHFLPAQEKEMMQQAFAQIKEADLIIAEVSEKAIGVGIEIGYAAALLKPLICLRQTAAPHSTTASGSASCSISYDDLAGLAKSLTTALTVLLR